MKTIYVLVFASLLAPAAAQADDTAVAPKSSKAVVAAAKTDAASVDPKAQKPIQISQQDRMRLCAKQTIGA